MNSPSPELACFVTGTDTEIGKTLVSSALLLFWQQQGFRSLGLKPIAAGAERVHNEWHNEDVDALAACSNVEAPISLRTPYLLQTPAAPHVAAALEGVRIDTQHIVDCFHQLRPTAQALVVEGVGGFRVPLNETHDTADLALALQLPVVLVVGLRLGCINQALLSDEAIRARGLPIAGWVANSATTDISYGAENVQAIAERINAPLLGVIPRLSGATAVARAHEAVAHLNAAALHRINRC